MTNRVKKHVLKRVHIDSVVLAIAICQSRSQADAMALSAPRHAAFASSDAVFSKFVIRRPRSVLGPLPQRQFQNPWQEAGQATFFSPRQRVPRHSAFSLQPWVLARTWMISPGSRKSLATSAHGKQAAESAEGENISSASASTSESGEDRSRELSGEAGSARAEPSADLEYWRSCMELADRPSAVRMLKKVDLTQPLGVPPKERAPGRKAETLLDVYARTRRRHPRKLILCRVGDFYEAFGFCAVLLVQFAGLNPMGSALPRAGCPVVNLRRTLRDLTDAGFSVVIMEEKPIPWGAKNRRKERYIAGVATPASPAYVHDMSLSTVSSDLSSPDQPPIVGVASLSARGFLVYEVSLDTRACKVMEGLTEEALLARLTAARCSPPLYLHQDTPPALAARLAAIAAHYHWSIVALPGSLAATSAAAPNSFLLHLLDAIRLDLDLSPSEPFTVAETSSLARPRPLYLTTAAQVGVLPRDGIPSLVDALVPSKAEALVKAFLRRWLLHPPPPAIATELRAAVEEVSALEASAVLPTFRVLSAAKIARYVTAGEANIAVLSDLHAALDAARAALEGERLGAMAAGLLRATQFETGVGQCDRDSVLAAAREVTADIEATVVLQEEGGGAEEDGGSGAEDEQRDAADSEREGDVAEDGADGDGEEGAWFAMERLVVLSEKFRDKVHRRCAEEAFASVERARGRLRAAIRDELLPVARALNAGKPKTAKRRARVQLDALNLAIWVKAGSSVSKEQTQALRLVNPRDRMSKLINDAYVTEEALEAISAYRQACEDASEEVRQVLRSLSGRIATNLPEVINGIVFCTLAKAVVLHVHEASRKGWCIPELVAKSEGPAADSDARELRMEEMIPYWMDPTVYTPQVVPNTMAIRGIVVLTGPNTAGKSTVMRSVCAVSLLGNCGLMVPAKRAEVPYQDSYYLRAASYDSPAEGLSSFAVEILDTATILRDASQHTLVLVDELGKGTETRAGSAIAGAVLEQLHRLRCRGVFTTHLHEIFELPLQLDGVQNLRMEIEMRANQSWAPTWRVEGRCRDSLAVYAAEKYGLPLEIVERARSLAQLRDGGELGGLVEFGPAREGSSRGGDGSAAAGEATEHEGDADGKCGEQHSKAARRGRIPEEERKSLEDAIAMLEEVSGDLGVSMGAQLVVVDRKSDPPPAAAAHACVYVARTSTGWFYVGETDHVSTRISNHRRKPRMRTASFACMQVRRGGKSVARRLESALIQALEVAGFPMLSRSDALHRQFAQDDNFSDSDAA